MRFILALKCFFLVLFFRRLPPEAARLLPPAEPAGLPPQEAEIVTSAKAMPLPVEVEPAPAPPAVDEGARGAVQVLALLQREGRLLDFLQEEIDAYSDAQVGAAVRDIHRGCRKALAEHVALEPVLRDSENARVRVDAGFDPTRIRLVGNVVGEPPFTGTLRHHGWRTARMLLPEGSRTADPSVVAPAEVELS